MFVSDEQKSKKRRGRPLTRGEKLLFRSVGFQPHMWVALDQHAAKRNTTRNALLEVAVLSYLAKADG